MKVIATQPGILGHRYVEHGEHFEIPDALFSSTWMVKEPEPEPPKTRTVLERLLEFVQRDIRSFF